MTAKRTTAQRGITQRVMTILMNRVGLVTTTEEIVRQLGKGVTAKQVGSSVSYLKTKKNTPIETVAQGAYRWVNEVPGGNVSATGGWVAPTMNDVLGMPNVSVVRGGIVSGVDLRGETVVLCDFTVVKRTKDVIVLQDTEDDTLWVARKL